MNHAEYAFKRHSKDLLKNASLLNELLEYIKKTDRDGERYNFVVNNSAVVIEKLYATSRLMRNTLKGLESNSHNSCKLHRNENLINDRRDGLTYLQLATKYELTVARCRQIVKRFGETYHSTDTQKGSK